MYFQWQLMSRNINTFKVLITDYYLLDLPSYALLSKYWFIYQSSKMLFMIKSVFFNQNKEYGYCLGIVDLIKISFCTYFYSLEKQLYLKSWSLPKNERSVGLMLSVLFFYAFQWHKIQVPVCS